MLMKKYNNVAEKNAASRKIGHVFNFILSQPFVISMHSPGMRPKAIIADPNILVREIELS